jgi:hypothetical protein
MLHAGLDLSRRKLDVCLLSERGEQVDQLAVAPDVDSLRTLARLISLLSRTRLVARRVCLCAPKRRWDRSPVPLLSLPSSRGS